MSNSFLSDVSLHSYRFVPMPSDIPGAPAPDPCEAYGISFVSNPTSKLKTFPSGVENCGKIKTSGSIMVFMTPGHDLILPNIYSIQSTSDTPIAIIFTGNEDTEGGSWTFKLPSLVSLRGSIAGAITGGANKVISMPKLNCWETGNFTSAVSIAYSGTGNPIQLQLGSDKGIDFKGNFQITSASALNYSNVNINTANDLAISAYTGLSDIEFPTLTQITGSFMIFSSGNSAKPLTISMPKLKYSHVIDGQIFVCYY